MVHNWSGWLARSTPFRGIAKGPQLRFPLGENRIGPLRALRCKSFSVDAIWFICAWTGALTEL